MVSMLEPLRIFFCKDNLLVDSCQVKIAAL